MQKLNFKKESPAKSISASNADPSMNRRTPRRSYERLAGVLIKGVYALQKAHQIGEGGMLLELPAHLQPGDFVLITLILPKSLAAVIGRAEVLYKKEKISEALAKTGVKFLNLDASMRRSIRDFVSAMPALDRMENRGKSKVKAPESLQVKLKKAS